MNAGIVKSKASGLALMGKVLVGGVVLGAGVIPQGAIATTQDAAFLQYIENACNTPIGPATANWDLISLGDLCGVIATSGGSGGAATASDVSSNLGTVNATGGAATRKKKGIRVSLDDQQEKSDKGASSDDSGWGVLVSPQYSKSNRTGTDLENGYQSKLTGLVVGVDRRFSDVFVLGLAVGSTSDKADFDANVGFLKAGNNTATVYGTWLSSETVAVDGYLGYGNIKYDNQRTVGIGTGISGILNSSTTGRQVMAGLSGSFQTDLSGISLAPTINLDYIRTSISGYSESGNNYNANLLALHYGDRDATSFTGSLGARFSTSYSYEWGALLPSLRLAVVHEFQNKTRQISNELVITPGASYQVETDEPDRNYLNAGIGVAAALNTGAQFFLDYEKRTQDKLLSSWAVSLGGLFEF